MAPSTLVAQYIGETDEVAGLADQDPSVDVPASPPREQTTAVASDAASDGLPESEEEIGTDDSSTDDSQDSSSDETSSDDSLGDKQAERDAAGLGSEPVEEKPATRSRRPKQARRLVLLFNTWDSLPGSDGGKDDDYAAATGSQHVYEDEVPGAATPRGSWREIPLTVTPEEGESSTWCAARMMGTPRRRGTVEGARDRYLREVL